MTRSCLHWPRKLNGGVYFVSFHFGYRIIKEVAFADACGMLKAEVPTLFKDIDPFPPMFYYQVERIEKVMGLVASVPAGYRNP